MKLCKTIIQALFVTLISIIVAFTYNAFSDNGINPFRKIACGDVLVDSSDERVASGIRVIGIEEFKSMMESGATVLDARTKEDYLKGHIPGAILFDYYQLPKYLEETAPYVFPGDRIVIYCSSPSCEDAELLARELHALDYTNLFVFRGGYSEWKEAGLPVEKGEQ